MGVRLAAVIGLVVVLLTCAAIGQGGAADAGVIIADLQCAGDVVVKRAGGAEVAAYVGLQLFPKDSITATAPAIVTLFDDGSGTTTQDVAPGTPFVVGAAAATKRELVAGLTSSISDLFGSAEQAHKRDREVGAVQAGAVIARLPVTDGGGGLPPKTEETQKLREMAQPPLPQSPKPAPGSSSNFSAPQQVLAPPPPPPVIGGDSLQDSAPAPLASPDANSIESTAAPAEMAEQKSKEPMSAPGGALSDDLDLDSPAQEDEGAVRSDKPKKQDTRTRGESGLGGGGKDARDGKRAAPVVVQLAELNWKHPLARARVVAVAEGVPALASAITDGNTTLTANGAPVVSVDQTLATGAKVRLKVAPASGAAWELEMTIATEAEWADVKRRAGELAKAKLPNKPLLVANLLEARGFVLMSYQLRLKTARTMERAGRTDGLMRSLWNSVGQQALLLGDWATASGMAAHTRKK